MILGRKCLLLLLSISTVVGLDKDKKFTPPDIASVETKTVNDGVTLAAVPYNTSGQAKTAFGKVNPYGILLVFVMIRNDTKKSVKLDRIKLEYIDRDRSRIENTQAAEVPFVKGPERPSFNPSPIPGVRLKKKNPLAADEIEMRAWAAKMLPPGESAHGFVYFRTGHRPGAKLYVTGLEDAATGKNYSSISKYRWISV